MCVATLREDTDQTWYLTQPQYSDTVPTSLNTYSHYVRCLAGLHLKTCFLSHWEQEARTEAVGLGEVGGCKWGERDGVFSVWTPVFLWNFVLVWYFLLCLQMFGSISFCHLHSRLLLQNKAKLLHNFAKFVTDNMKSDKLFEYAGLIWRIKIKLDTLLKHTGLISCMPLLVFFIIIQGSTLYLGVVYRSNCGFVY